MSKILLLEDDKLYSETLKDFLEEEGFEVESVYDPYSAYDLVFENSYSLYLFDINLPFEDGITALENLRKADDRTPAIFITSREDRDSLLNGFRVGGDDYIKKPIDLDELLLRIKALLKRSLKSSRVRLGEYELDRDKRDLFLNGEALHIGLKPFALLELFVENDGRALSFDEIYKTLWRSQEASNGALRVYIAKLKRYFPNAIETLRGYGYKFESAAL